MACAEIAGSSAVPAPLIIAVFVFARIDAENLSGMVFPYAA